MPSINRITHSDQLVEEKINYFLDRIDHAATYAGWQSQLELESPTSLVGKVIFRLQQDTEYRLVYLDNYFKKSFFTTDTFWDSYPTYSKVKSVIAQYNQLGKSDNARKIQLLDSATFQKDLATLRRDLEYKLAEDLINGVNHILVCRHQLGDFLPNTTQTHAAAFESLALTLVSEYVFRGYTRGEIKAIVNNVLDKKPASFPFPPNIKSKLQREKHLKQMTLLTLLQGFANAFGQAPQEGIILVKVYGGIFPDHFSFRYNKVSFYSRLHPQLDSIKAKMKIEDVENFFAEGHYIIAEVSLTWHSPYSMMDKIKMIIRQELNFLSAILDRDFSIDTSHNYIRLTTKGKYFGLAWSSQRFENSFSDTALEELTDNGYQALRKVKGESVDWFLKFEPLFVMAHKNNSITDYWLYLETLLSYNQPKKKIKGLVSAIILSTEKFIRDRRIMTTLRDCFTPLTRGFHLLDIPHERRQKVMAAFKKGKVAREVRKIPYPFIRELIREYDEPLTADYYKNARQYYHDILTEAYEYRNFVVHSGLDNDLAREKLSVTFPRMVVRVRWAIFEALKTGSHNTPFDIIIEALVKKGEAFLK